MIDNALSPRLAEALLTAGVDAVHVAELGLAAGSDEVVLARALATGRALLTRDGDFGGILAASGARLPSVLLFRSQVHDRPSDQLPMVIAAVEAYREHLIAGAIVVIDDGESRVRRLPLP